MRQRFSPYDISNVRGWPCVGWRSRMKLVIHPQNSSHSSSWKFRLLSYIVFFNLFPLHTWHILSLDLQLYKSSSNVKIKSNIEYNYPTWTFDRMKFFPCFIFYSSVKFNHKCFKCQDKNIQTSILIPPDLSHEFYALPKSIG